MKKTFPPGQLRVLIVCSHLKGMGGAEKNILDVARGLRDRCVIEVAALQCGPLTEDFLARGIPVHDFGVARLFSPSAVVRAFRLSRRLRRDRYDLVMTYHHDADLWAGFAAWMAGVPVISSRRDMGYQLSRAHVWLYRMLNPAFRRIVAVSDAVRREVIRVQWANPRSIVIIRNGLEHTPSAVDKSTARRELDLDPERPVIGMVASFRRVKGQEFLVRAAAEVIRRRPDAQFVVVGDTNTDYFHEVQALARDLGVDENIRCVGARADVPRALAAFDIFALPSRQEGFSNALVEAMAAGVPPVAAAVGGNPEAVDHGVNGLLFDSGDHGTLARHLLALLENPASRDRMGAAAVAKVAEDFSYAGMLDAVYALFVEASGRRVSGAELSGQPAQAGRRS